MRHKIIPEIMKLNPSYQDSLSRLSTIAAETDNFITQFSEEKLRSLVENQNNKIIIDRKKFTSLSPIIQKEVIKILMTDAGVSRDLTSNQVDDIVLILGKNIGGKKKIVQGRLKIELKAGKVVISRLQNLTG